MRHFLRKVREEIFKYKAYGRIRRFRNRAGKTCLLGRRRRVALWACAGGIVCMLLTGCAAPASTVPESSEEQSRVSLRNDGAEAKLVLVELETSQARTAALREIADKYEADFPKTEIEIITLKNAQELEARLSAGGQTDLLELHSGWVPAYVEKGMLKDIKPYMEVWDEWYSLSAAAKQGARCMGEEHVYLLPASTSQDALYYRKDWFESYNDAHPESTLLVPRVWEEVEKAAAALSDQGAGLAVAGKDLLVDYMDSVVWSSVNVGRMADISAAYFSREFEGKSIFSLEQAQKGMSQFVSVFSQAVPAEALQWEEAEAAEAFQQGKTALLLAGEDVYPFLEENMEEGEWGVAVYPRGGAGLAVFSDDFAGWGVSAASASTETAVHFLCFLSNADNNTHLSKVTDTTPVHLTSYELDDFFLEGKRAVYTEMMKRSDWYQFASEPQRYEAYSGYRQEANDRLRDLLSGKTTQQDLLSWLGEYWDSAYAQEGKKW